MSNLVSGVILLIDRSIKPGDVIEVDGRYGWITGLNARYVSLATRDGKEILIPNENLITEKVTNWSFSNNLVRQHVSIGIAYESDVHLAIRLALQAVAAVPRALKDPEPVCLLKEFGDSSVNLELRFWIHDPVNGTSNVRSEVMLQVWDLFHANGISFPFPQRDLTLRNPEALAELFSRPPGRQEGGVNWSGSAWDIHVDGDVLALGEAVEHAFEGEFAADAALLVAAVGVARLLAETLVNLHPAGFDGVRGA